jgi:hypothetical protein
MRSATSHASHPGAPGMRGTSCSGSHGTPSNLAAPLPAKASASPDWWLPRTLIPYRPVSRMKVSRSEPRSSAIITIGGFIDSDAKELMVVPCGRFPAMVVTTDTGVHTPAITSRNVSDSEFFRVAATRPPCLASYRMQARQGDPAPAVVRDNACRAERIGPLCRSWSWPVGPTGHSLGCAHRLGESQGRAEAACFSAWYFSDHA